MKIDGLNRINLITTKRSNKKTKQQTLGLTLCHSIKFPQP